MTEWDVELEMWPQAAVLEYAVEAACAAEGLTATLKGSLTAFPGCVHWHWKRGKERGVLEATLWPDGRRLWLSVHEGRTGIWTHATAERVRERLAAAKAQEA